MEGARACYKRENKDVEYLLLLNDLHVLCSILPHVKT